ncbi:glycosyltransferase family 2 protein [Vibrio breoganii]
MPIKVSIIMPCYNSRQTIEDAINSVLAQTYTNWELLIVDDSSTDTSFELTTSIAKVDPRVTVYQMPENSGGPSQPRNYAISKAKGEIICFLDSDDIWYADKLDKQITFMTAKNIDFCYSAYNIKEDAIRELQCYKPQKQTNYAEMLKRNSIGCLTVALRKRCLKSVFFKDIRHEDYDFWLQILSKNIVTAYCCSEKPLAEYRVSDNSRSSNKLRLLKDQWHIFFVERNLSFFTCIGVYCRFLFNYLLKYR